MVTNLPKDVLIEKRKALMNYNKGQVVVIDNYLWIASINNSKSEVYSCDGDKLLLFKLKEDYFELLEMNLVDNRLAVTSRQKIMCKSKGENVMEGINLGDLGGIGEMNLGDIGEQNLQAMDAFEGVESGNAATSGDIEPSSEIKNTNKDLIAFCKRYGLFEFFLTKNDAVVKPSKRETPIKNTEHPNGILTQDAMQDEEIVKKFESGSKIPVSKLKKETSIVFNEAAPGKAFGVVIAMPAGVATKFNFINKIFAKEKVSFDETQTDRVYIPMSSEQAFTLITSCFYGEIKEDPHFVGESKASYLQVIYEKRESKENGVETGREDMRAKFVLNNANKQRKSLLTDDNYFPISVYAKANQQSLTPDEREALNIALESIVKNQDSYEKLGESAKALIKWTPDKSVMVDAEWFREGSNTPIRVKPFWNKSKDGAFKEDCQLAYKKKSYSKENKVSYRFVTYGMDDMENGPLSIPKYKDMLDYIGISQEVFAEKISQMTRRKGKGAKTKENQVSIDTVLEKFSTGDTSDFAAGSFTDLDSISDLLSSIS